MCGHSRERRICLLTMFSIIIANQVMRVRTNVGRPLVNAYYIKATYILTLPRHNLDQRVGR